MVQLIAATGDRTPAPAPPPGRLTAESRTEFELNEDGDFTNCRTSAAHGFGIARNAYWGACGPALAMQWFEACCRLYRSPMAGALEIKVYAER